MKKRWLFVGAGAVVLAAALICTLLTPRAVTATGFAMGSVLTQTQWIKQPRLSVLSEIQALEAQMLQATEAPALALEIMEASGGAFNPYLGALVKLWNINGEPHLPTQEEIFEALQKKEIDLGAYGKGAACDTAFASDFRYLKRGVLSLGGNILTCGIKPWGQPFKIALRDPNGGPNDAIGVFTLRGTWFISTSGSYEKYFERDGKKYHHILDPETGYPAQRDPGLVSVTVLTREGEAPGALGDMVSTACFVLGYEASQDLLELYGCDALFIYDTGEIRPAGHVMEYWSET